MSRVCYRGHVVEGENLYVAPSGRHYCRECQRLRGQAFNDRQKEKRRLEGWKPSGRPPVDMQHVAQRLVLQADGCLVWPGAKALNGYGVAQINRKKFHVHRAIYEHYNGPVPNGLVLHHECRNRLCANVAHLTPCTINENIRKDHPDISGRAQRTKTHCRQGHPLSGHNLLRDAKGHRYCRTCAYASHRRYRERLKHGSRTD